MHCMPCAILIFSICASPLPPATGCHKAICARTTKLLPSSNLLGQLKLQMVSSTYARGKCW